MDNLKQRITIQSYRKPGFPAMDIVDLRLVEVPGTVTKLYTLATRPHVPAGCETFSTVALAAHAQQLAGAQLQTDGYAHLYTSTMWEDWKGSYTEEVTQYHRADSPIVVNFPNDWKAAMNHKRDLQLEAF